MKKTPILLILLLSLSFSLNSQTVNFGIQSDGTFKNVIDGKTFVVIERDGKSQSELYSEILIAITRLYNSPKDVISKVENEVISVNGISEDCVTQNLSMGMKNIYSIQYILQFQFKDGKIRVEAPVVSRFFTHNNPDVKPFSGWLNVQNIFKKGMPNPKKQNTIDDFNNTFNDIINNIISNKVSNDEDW